MLYSLNWLKELVDLKGIPINKLVDLLNQYSFEVEDFRTVRKIGTKDTVLDIDFGKTNRVDILGHFGMATEIAAITGGKLKTTYQNQLQRFGTGHLALKIDKTICEKIALSKLQNIKQVETPKWMSSRLENVGLNSVNIIVDITNYVMLELGQPMHAFDAEAVTGKDFIVKKATVKTKIKTLDEKIYQLEKEDGVIINNDKIISVAGIMGGYSTRTTKKTSTIILEAARWDPGRIRKTSWRLNLKTDAARRFEKGLPTQFIDVAMNRAIYLFKELCGAKVEAIQIKKFTTETASTIRLPLSYPSERLGYSIDNKKIERLFKNLQLPYGKKKTEYEITVPFWRPDLEIAEDVVEEIGRLSGYDEIPEKRPLIAAVPKQNEDLSIYNRLRDSLVGLGFIETYNYSFYSTQEAEKFGLDLNKHLELANPMSSEQALLRLSLLPNLTKVLGENAKYYTKVRAFEVGNVYSKKETKKFHDSPRLALGIASLKLTPKQLFFSLKGRLGALFEALQLDLEFVPPGQESTLLKELKIVDKSGKIKGRLGLIPPSTKGSNQAVSEIDLTELREEIKEESYRPISKYPKQSVDLAIIVDRTISWKEIEETVKNEGTRGLAIAIQLFDVYQGKQIPKQKKSLAFNLAFQAIDRTLTDTEVNKILTNVKENLKSRLNAIIR